MRVSIIGGGVAGLAAAYDLAATEHEVTIYEAGDRLGGLAGSFDFGGAEIERFYHFICKPDTDLQELVKELGLGDSLHWQHSPMGYFVDGKEYPFGTPVQLLQFSPISLRDRIRLGLMVLRSRLIRDWKPLESRTAKEWLIELVGEQAYEVVWAPLLRVKFGSFHGDVAASWMWHRIHRVAQSRDGLMAKERMGYLERGSQVIVDRLTEELARGGVTVELHSPVQEIIVRDGRCGGIATASGVRESDVVISTVALPLLARMLPDSAEAFRADIASIDYIGVVCMILKLRHPISGNFWLNVNDPAIAFNGIIEYTNLNPRPDLGGAHIAYIPFYVDVNEPRFQTADADLFAEYCDALRRVNPAFETSWVIDYRVFRDRFAQAVCTKNFYKRVPAHRAPVDGLFVCDSTQLYPSDRTISGMIGIGRRVAKMAVASA